MKTPLCPIKKILKKGIVNSDSFLSSKKIFKKEDKVNLEPFLSPEKLFFKKGQSKCRTLSVSQKDWKTKTKKNKKQNRGQSKRRFLSVSKKGFLKRDKVDADSFLSPEKVFFKKGTK